MSLHCKNKYIPWNSNIRVLYLIKIASFNLPTTSNHPCDELFANANFWSLFIGRLAQYIGAQDSNIPCMGGVFDKLHAKFESRLSLFACLGNQGDSVRNQAANSASFTMHLAFLGPSQRWSVDGKTYSKMIMCMTENSFFRFRGENIAFKFRLDSREQASLSWKVLQEFGSPSLSCPSSVFFLFFTLPWVSLVIFAEFFTIPSHYRHGQFLFFFNTLL